MKKFLHVFAGTIAAGITLLLIFVQYIQISLPENFSLEARESFVINSRMSLTKAEESSNSNKKISPKIYDDKGNSYNLNLSLFEQDQAKQVQVQVVERKMVVPGGSPFGIKMFTDGVMVVGMSDIQIGTANVNPAKNSGLKIGDLIISIDDNLVDGNTDVAEFISNSGGHEIKFTIKRSGNTLDIYLQPVKSEYDKAYRAGIWVRDSSAGIGTMTFYDPDTLGFAGLGHAICDVDTGNIMPLSKGEIVDVNISGVNAGQSGKPGELKGSFNGDSAVGALKLNTETGIFGILNAPYFGGEAIPMALKQDVHPGPAVIYSTISGNKPQAFDVMVEKVNYSDINSTKNMVIKIIDKELLAATGGIVQGMSGSPIIQDERLVGAVTHVFVNDPTRGYGIFAENMNIQLENVEINEKSA